MKTKSTLPRDERLARISAMLVRGLTQREIAKALELSDATVSREVAKMEAKFRQAAEADFMVSKGLDLMRIERMVATLLPRATNTSDRGQIGAARVVKELLERKAKMLGYDAPDKVQQAVVTLDARELPTLDVSHMSLQEQAALDGLLTKALPETT